MKACNVGIDLCASLAVWMQVMLLYQHGNCSDQAAQPELEEGEPASNENRPRAERAFDSGPFRVDGVKLVSRHRPLPQSSRRTVVPIFLAPGQRPIACCSANLANSQRGSCKFWRPASEGASNLDFGRVMS